MLEDQRALESVLARQSNGGCGHVQSGVDRALRQRHDQAGGQRLLGRASRAADEEGLACGAVALLLRVDWFRCPRHSWGVGEPKEGEGEPPLRVVVVSEW